MQFVAMILIYRKLIDDNRGIFTKFAKANDIIVHHMWTTLLEFNSATTVSAPCRKIISSQKLEPVQNVNTSVTIAAGDVVASSLHNIVHARQSKVMMEIFVTRMDVGVISRLTHRIHISAPTDIIPCLCPLL